MIGNKPDVRLSSTRAALLHDSESVQRLAMDAETAARSPKQYPITCHRCIAVPEPGTAARALSPGAYADPSVFAGNPLSSLPRRFGLTYIRKLPEQWYLGVQSVRPWPIRFRSFPA